MPVATYKREYNFGNVMQVLAILGTVGAAMWAASGWQAKTDLQMTAIGNATAANTAAIQTLISSQAVQDERIATLATAIIRSDKVNADIAIQLNAIREDLAGIKQQIRGTIR